MQQQNFLLNTNCIGIFHQSDKPRRYVGSADLCHNIDFNCKPVYKIARIETYQNSIYRHIKFILYKIQIIKELEIQPHLHPPPLTTESLRTYPILADPHPSLETSFLSFSLDHGSFPLLSTDSVYSFIYQGKQSN